MDEIQDLEELARYYHSAEVNEGVEHFHLHLRDVVIPDHGGKSALELGCGIGRWTKVLCMRYEEIHVVEAAAPLLDAVVAAYQGVGGTLTGHAGLVEDFLKSTDRTWQHVYLSMLLEHVADPQSIIASALKACSQEGSVFIVVPNASSIHRVLAQRAGIISSIDELSNNDLKVGHRRVYTHALLSQHLEEAGCRHFDILPVGLKPITHEQMKVLPDSILEALCRSGDLTPSNSAYLVARVHN